MDFNLMRLMGNLGADPSTKDFDDGNKVVKLSVATNSAWTNKTTGEQHQDTEWHTVYFRGKMASVAEEYLKKGHRVYIEGKKRTRSYMNDNNEKMWVSEVLGKKLLMLPSTQDNQHTPSSQEPTGQSEAAASNQTAAPVSAAAQPVTQPQDTDAVAAAAPETEEDIKTDDGIQSDDQVESDAAGGNDLVTTNEADVEEDLDLDIQEDFSDEFNKKSEAAAEEDNASAHGDLPDWLIP